MASNGMPGDLELEFEDFELKFEDFERSEGLEEMSENLVELRLRLRLQNECMLMKTPVRRVEMLTEEWVTPFSALWFKMEEDKYIERERRRCPRHKSEDFIKVHESELTLSPYGFPHHCEECCPILSQIFSPVCEASELPGINYGASKSTDNRYGASKYTATRYRAMHSKISHKKEINKRNKYLRNKSLRNKSLRNKSLRNKSLRNKSSRNKRKKSSKEINLQELSDALPDISNRNASQQYS